MGSQLRQGLFFQRSGTPRFCSPEPLSEPMAHDPKKAEDAFCGELRKEEEPRIRMHLLRKLRIFFTVLFNYHGPGLAFAAAFFKEKSTEEDFGPLRRYLWRKNSELLARASLHHSYACIENAWEALGRGSGMDRGYHNIFCDGYVQVERFESLTLWKSGLPENCWRRVLRDRDRYLEKLDPKLEKVRRIYGVEDIEERLRRYREGADDLERRYAEIRSFSSPCSRSSQG